MRKDEWIQLGFHILIEQGTEKLKIAYLCDLKKVTKGSFYHHFKNRQDFLDALLAYWLNVSTTKVIEASQNQMTPIERLKMLDNVLSVTDIEAELHIRNWALKESKVQVFLASLDKQRLDYLKNCYTEFGVAESSCEQLAEVCYASFIGMLQLLSSGWDQVVQPYASKVYFFCFHFEFLPDVKKPRPLPIRAS